MKVLVIGGGGREHALAWRLKQSTGVTQVYVAPGNAGTARDTDLINLPLTDKAALRAWVQDNGIALTVVGPEAPLAAGVVDEFRAHGLAIFGPTQKAAQLESSKAFSKAFMQRHGIPTAEYQTFTDPQQAHAYVDAKGAPIVIKADGLAAGKGVVVAMTMAEAPPLGSTKPMQVITRNSGISRPGKPPIPVSADTSRISVSPRPMASAIFSRGCFLHLAGAGLAAEPITQLHRNLHLRATAIEFD